MSATAPQKLADLKRLSIERAQRPTSRGGGWLILLAISLTITAVAAGAGWWYYHTTGASIIASLSEKVVEVSLLIIPREQESAPRQVLLVANGRIVSDRQVNVATKVSGQITELYVEQGDRVEAEQVLARVEDTIYQAQRDEAAANVARQKTQIERARAERDRSKASIAEATAKLEFEKRNHDRLKRLYEGGQSSDFEYLNAKNQWEAAAAALDVTIAADRAAEVAVAAAETELQAAEATLRVLQKRLDDCAIRAPIAGVILERNAQVGDFVAAEGGRGANANAQLVRIADMSLLRVEVDISERDVHRLSPGGAARVTPDANRSQFYDGQIMWIDPQGDYAKATVQTKVRIIAPGPSLRVDGSAKVEFLAPSSATSSPSSQPTIWLPKSAVQLNSDNSNGSVFTVIKERAVANQVKIGARSDTSVEILNGVYAGMQLIVNVDGVKDATPVKVTRTLTMSEL